MKMELNENSGRVVSREEAEKSIEKHTANRAIIEQSGGKYIESFFVGANVIKQLVGKTPVKNIMGLRIKKSIDDQNEDSLILELIYKDKTSSREVADDLPKCPTLCL